MKSDQNSEKLTLLRFYLFTLQLLSPLAEGTFQRAILQSGTALGISWGAPNTPEKATKESFVTKYSTKGNDRKFLLPFKKVSDPQALQYAGVLSTGVGCGEGCGV